MKVEIYIALNSEIRIKTQFKTTFNKYTKYRKLTKRLVLLPVVWDKYGLLFTKGLQIIE